MNNLTVLIPTSPIPSHPSTAILDETISNIRKYTDAKIIIMFDGIHESLEHRRAAYEEYYNNVFLKKELYGNCTLLRMPVHNHQSMMTRYALCNLVKTPLVMFCEHDTSPIGEIPLNIICEVIKQSKDINCIRFNIFEKIPQEHNYLMLDVIDCYKPSYYDTLEYLESGEEQDLGEKITLTRTIQWSQRPHIAKTEWYIKILETYLKDQRSMIEDVMHSVVQTAYEAQGKDTFGLAIYTPDGNQLRSYHSDGRGEDEKIISA